MPTIRPAGTALLLTVALLALPPLRPVAAQTPAVGFTANAYGVEDDVADALASPTGSFSLGFEFTATAPALVSALGFFNDPSFNPSAPFSTVNLNPLAAGSRTFAQPHPVGLYQIVGGVSTLLASTTVTLAGVKNGDFLYQSLAVPVLLVTGGDYVLAGVTGPTDPYVFNIEDDTQPGAVGLTQNGITYVQDRYAVSSTLTLPTLTDTGSTPGFFGPNLLLSAPIPEASTPVSLGLLLALGLGGVIASWCRKGARVRVEPKNSLQCTGISRNTFCQPRQTERPLSSLALP